MGNYSILQCASPIHFQGNKTGILVIHGFTGTTQSIRFLSEQFRDAGYTVLAPRLSGHGTAPQDMAAKTYLDWIFNVEEALATLKETCTTIFVAGLSMGGTLTLYLAEKYPEIAGIMPINAAIDLPGLKKDYEKFTAEEKRYVDGIGSDVKDEEVKELAYRQTPVKAMEQLLLLMEEVREKLSLIKMPTLIFSSEVDHVVPPENSQYIFDAIRSETKTIQSLENSYHVATIDHDKELIASKCLQFIAEEESKHLS